MEFTNIAQAIKAIRDRKLTMFCTSCHEEHASQPTLKSDKDLTIAIMALGVKLYKDEKGIRD